MFSRNRLKKHFGIWGWAYLAFLALLLCISVESRCFLFTIESSTLANAINNIILALSYSYIAAAIFHCIVIVIPFRRRKKVMAQYLNNQLFVIRENLRLCKLEIIPFEALCSNKVTKKQFVSIFSKQNIYTKSLITKRFSKLSRFNELRISIINTLNIILAYREYIDDGFFDLLNSILNSEFIRNGIDPSPGVSLKDKIGYNDNQASIGECIYDLYERVNSYYQQQCANYQKF